MIISKKRNALKIKKSKKKINSNRLKKYINKSKIRGGIPYDHSGRRRREAARNEATAAAAAKSKSASSFTGIKRFFLPIIYPNAPLVTIIIIKYKT